MLVSLRGMTLSRIRRLLVGFLFVLLVGGPAMAGEAAAKGAPSEPLDYSKPQNWVCGPRSAGCHDDLSTAVLRADGSIQVESFQPNSAPMADCFYVYPTVSNGDGLIAEPQTTEAERRAVRQQVLRLSSVCRLFVPLYRQVTYTSMKPGFQRPGPTPRRRRSGWATRTCSRRGTPICAWRMEDGRLY